MTDCPNADVRDRLPDLLHERLDASTRGMVVAHVEGCAACRAQLDLLRNTRRLFVAGTPPADVEGIVMALPLPPRAGARPPTRRWLDWRMAAAVTVFAIGAGSFALVARGPSNDVPRVEQAPVSSTASPTVPSSGTTGGAPLATTPTRRTEPGPTAAIPSTSKTEAMSAPAAPAQTVATARVREAAGPGLAMTGRLHELSTQQLEALLKDLEQLEAVPVTEPDPVTLPVTPAATGRRSSGIGASE